MVVVLALFVAACGGGSDTAKSGDTKAAADTSAGVSHLTIMTQAPAFGFLPLQAMIDDGFAKKRKLDIDYLYFGQGGGSLSGIFAGGSGDMFLGGLEGAVALASTGAVPVSVIASLYQRGVWVLVSKKGSPYKSLSDLKGKTVGISGPGAFSDTALRALINESNMSPSDFKIAALGRAPTQLAALETGAADAVQLQTPVLEQALADGKVQVVHSFQEDPTASLVATVRTKDLKANPLAYKRFLEAYRDAMKRITDDPAYAADLAKRVWGETTSDALLKTQLASYLTNPGIWSQDGVLTKDIFDSTTQLLVDSGGYTADKIPSYQDLTKSADLVAP